MSKKRLNSWENEVSRLAVNEIVRSPLSMDAAPVIISEELEARVSSCIFEERHIKQKRLISKNIAVIFIAAIIAIMSAFVAAAIINGNSDKYIIKYYDEYFTLRTRPPKNFSIMKDEDFVKRVPTFIPDEYELQADSSYGVCTDLVYWNPTINYYIIYQQYQTSRTTFKIDAERSHVIHMKINGYDGIAVLWNSDGVVETGLYWGDGTYDYAIFAPLSIEETLAIAESIDDIQ